MTTPQSEPLVVKVLPDSVDVPRAVASFALTAGAAIALVYVQRKVSSPDFFIQLRLRTLSIVQEYADSRCKFWHEIGARAALAYLESRA